MRVIQLFQVFPPSANASNAQKELYADIVPEHMDFETIKERLKSKSYTAPAEFNRHVWLILNNAKEFYRSNEMRKADAMVEIAELVLRDFEEDWANTLAKLREEEGSSKASSVFASDPPLHLPRCHTACWY